MNQPIKNRMKRLVISAFVLKIIVSLLMLTDHIQVVFNAPDFFRWIARIALPIYIPFMIAYGCKHTRNTNKYLLRLGIFALISEIPFDLAFSHFDRIDFFSQTNVFYTLFLGAACITIYEKLKTKKRPWMALLPMLIVIPLNPILVIIPPISIIGFFNSRNIFSEVRWLYVFLIIYGVYIALTLFLCTILQEKDKNIKNNVAISFPRKVISLFPALPLLYFADILGTDGGTTAVAFILLTYLANPENKVKRAIMMTSYVAVIHIYPFLYYRYEGYNHGWYILPGGMMNNGNQSLPFFLFALIGVALVCFYNGKQGRKLKWAFYSFYPAHLATLAIIWYIFASL